MLLNTWAYQITPQDWSLWRLETIDKKTDKTLIKLYRHKRNENLSKQRKNTKSPRQFLIYVAQRYTIADLIISQYNGVYIKTILS